MKKTDRIIRFLIDGTPIRGQLVTLDNSWQKCFQQSAADPQVKMLLGQALSATALLASTLKIDGNITLQIRGNGAIHLLVAQATSERSIRGIIRQSAEIDKPQAQLTETFGTDKIVITIDNGKGNQHQGIVPLSGTKIAHALQAYFEHSEQLPTQLWLASNKSSACGLLLQKLPADSNPQFEDSDSWNRVTQLASTITDQELLELDQQEILHRLFHEESLRVFDAETMRFACSCSREKTAGMIKSLGQNEAEDIIAQQGKIDVNCEFCDTLYQFDPVDVKQLFETDVTLAATQTRH